MNYLLCKLIISGANENIKYFRNLGMYILQQTIQLRRKNKFTIG